MYLCYGKTGIMPPFKRNMENDLNILEVNIKFKLYIDEYTSNNPLSISIKYPGGTIPVLSYDSFWELGYTYGTQTYYFNFIVTSDFTYPSINESNFTNPSINQSNNWYSTEDYPIPYKYSLRPEDVPLSTVAGQWTLYMHNSMLDLPNSESALSSMGGAYYSRRLLVNNLYLNNLANNWTDINISTSSYDSLSLAVLTKNEAEALFRSNDARLINSNYVKLANDGYKKIIVANNGSPSGSDIDAFRNI